MSKKITNTSENLLIKYRVNNLTKVVDYLLSISRRSKRTAFAYSFALDHLNKFVERNYNNYNIQTILEPLKKEERQEKENNIIDVYNLLDRFVSYLHNDTINGHALSPLSVKLYMAAAKSYLSYNDLEITASKFKRRVKMPPVYREDEEAVDAKDIRQILLACNNL
jgi:integrase